MVQFSVGRKGYLAVTLLGLLAFISSSCQQSVDTNLPTLTTPVSQNPDLITPTPLSLTQGPSLPPRYSNGTSQQEVVTVGIVSASEEPVGIQVPAFLEAEVAGRQIKNVVLLAGHQDEDGDRRLLLYDELNPNPHSDEIKPWPDGVHEIVQVWNTNGDYLADDASGDFVLLRDSNLGEEIRSVDGRYRSAGQDEYSDARLIVDSGAGGSTGLIESATGSSISPQPGDEFQIANIYLLEDMTLARSPGVSLIFNQYGQIRYEKRPLPGGLYFLGIASETMSGMKAVDSRGLTVGNEILRAGVRAYFGPVKHFQFLYPEYLMEITEDGERLATQNISGTLKMTITNYPESYQKQVDELKSDVLSTFGNVQILYEDTAPLGSAGALWTAYGYEADDGSHSGIFLVFYQDGLAYVVDVDGRTDEEVKLLETIEILSQSWVTRPGVEGQMAGDWQPVSVNGFNLGVPTEYQYNELTNDWHKFSKENGLAFFSLRSEPATGGRILDRMRHWLEIAARDVAGFAYSDFYTLDLGENSWVRLDFTYNLNDGTEIAGNIMAARADDQLLFVWAEASEEIYDSFEREEYFISLLSAS